MLLSFIKDLLCEKLTSGILCRFFEIVIMNLHTYKPILSAIAVLLAGFSVTFTKKLNDSLSISCELTGGNLMNILVTSGLAEFTGLCGVCISYKDR